MIIEFGEYLPDLPDYANPGSTVAKNVLPTARGYRGVPTLTASAGAVYGNLLTFSEEFDNAAWTKTNVTLTTNDTTAPDSTTTAERMTEDVTGVFEHMVTQAASGTVANGETYTVSAYVKQGTSGTRRALLTLTDAGSERAYIAFNFSTLNVVSGGGTNATATAVGNGWYRLSITGTLNSGTDATLRLKLAQTDGNSSFYEGDGTSNFYIWGAQIIKQSVPGTYYKTTSAAVTISPTLDARCQGAASVNDKDGNVYIYAGDTAKLYVNDQNSWTDVSKAGSPAYAVGADEFWEFAKWGEKVIAVSGVNTAATNNPQIITMGGTAFADLSGTPPQARHIAVVRDFVVLGNTWDSGGGLVPHQVWWSGINDETTWTPSAATQADKQPLQGNGGWVQRVVGGEYGVVFQERSIWRMTYVGLPVVFQFDEIAPGVGTPAPGSVAQWGDLIFFLGQDGFRVVENGSTTRPIGDQKVDQTVLDDLDSSAKDQVTATIDPVNKYYLCAYVGSGATGTFPNRIMAYHWPTGRWSLIEQDVALLMQAATAGYTLDTLDTVSTSLDALTESLDSRAWMGGALQLGAFDSSHQLGFFSGSNMAATLETKEFELKSGLRSMISRVRPMVDGGSANVEMGARNAQTGTTTYQATATAQTYGGIPVRAEARFHRIRANVSGAFTNAFGVDVEAGRPSGFR